MKIRILLSYKGSRFFGWQRQKHQRTVQSELEKSLFQIFQKKILVIGSGRTDTGVHALGQTAHFEIEESLLKKKKLSYDLENNKLKQALNAVCPSDIAVLDCWEAPLDFHARSSAVKKTYLYFLFTGDSPPVLFSDLIWWRKEPLELKKLNRLAQVFIGNQDFKSFQNSGSTVGSTVRKVSVSCWTQLSTSLYCYKITGSGFLKQMVRNIVGTSVELVNLEGSVKKLEQILHSKDRKQAFKTAPGQGLYLKEVFYPPSLDKACRLL